MRVNPNSNRIVIVCPTDLKQEFYNEAKAIGMSGNSLLIHILREWLQNQKGA